MLETLIRVKRKHQLTLSQIIFLNRWYKICHKRFGFHWIPDNEQMVSAINFMKEIERKWQNKINENLTDNSFVEFFYHQALIENIDLPKDFIYLMAKPPKGEQDEFKTT